MAAPHSPLLRVAYDSGMSALAELYTIPQEHLDFRDTIRRIAQERIAPPAAESDHEAEHPQHPRALRPAPGPLMLNLAIEEIAKACASTALILMVNELGTLPIKLLGTEEQQQRF